VPNLEIACFGSGKTEKILTPSDADLLYSCDEFVLSGNEELLACKKNGIPQVEVWNLKTGDIFARIDTPFPYLQTMEFVKNDTALLLSHSGKNGYKARYYTLRDDRTVIENAIKNLAREMTEAERKRYFID
jgi:hypothetical protein